MAEERVLHQLGRTWWLTVLRGVAAILFGVLAFVWPGVTLLALVVLWGAYAFADGVLALISAFNVRTRNKPLWALLLTGLLGIGAGIVTWLMPGLTALALLTLLAFWAVATGILQIVTAIRLRKELEREWLLALSGALSVLFGIIVLMRPGTGALALVWVIGAWAVAFGIMLVALGLRLRPHAPGGAVPA
jgi:uncharacterized membrane protein HdeD (DUF308 family)